MKQITTAEERDKALKWMVEIAEHPLEPVKNDVKTKRIYDLVSEQVQAFNKQLYAGSEFPNEHQVQEKAEPNDLAGWLD
ncbi:hypothetical protein [Bacillus sp. FJAT-45037]|uniref:hypothetical protein n=1 Tax=Bacillus sp. FJAT-45037 TaxID=2011007 RepID=UPI000C23CE67|nr:hypothetical protein [Bacillus sp. FJAT-45037]